MNTDPRKGNFDVIVVGLGAVGSATVCHLAKLGGSTLGIDQFPPPHNKGSSHGETRITRQASGEGSHLTALALRSISIWQEMEERFSLNGLFTRTGLLAISSPHAKARVHVDDFFQSTVAAARENGIEHEVLDSNQLKERFGQFKTTQDEVGYYEPGAGFLRPESCIEANLKAAASNGAQLNFEERVQSIKYGRIIEVQTDSNMYRTEKLIISAGSWINELVPQLSQHFKIYRQVLYWFDIEENYDRFKPDCFPVFIWEPTGVPWGIYGFPAVDGAGGGIKVAAEYLDGMIQSPDQLNREVLPEEEAHMYENYVAPFFDGIGRKCLKSSVCMYTVSPDSGFLIDRLPGEDNVWIASACSGHGFKHSAALGEALARTVTTNRGDITLSPFTLTRLLE